MEKTAAFFDVDYTILAKASGTLFMKHMFRTGEAGIADLLKTLFWWAQHKLNLLDMEKMTRKFMHRYIGTREDETIEISDQWFSQEVAQHIYPEAVELIRRHQAQGHIIVIATAATIYLTRPLCRHLGVEDFICSIPEVKDGVFTGNFSGPLCYGAGKAQLAERLCREKGIDLSRSFFYTDSVSDLELMQKVGHPFAVNPDPLLRQTARQKNWKIIDFDR